MPKHVAPAPEKVTVSDIIHVIFSILMIPLGLIILYHAITRIQNVMGYMVGIAFIAFGTYRLYMAYSRYNMFKHNRSKITK